MPISAATQPVPGWRRAVQPVPPPPSSRRRPAALTADFRAGNGRIHLIQRADRPAGHDVANIDPRADGLDKVIVTRRVPPERYAAGAVGRRGYHATPPAAFSSLTASAEHIDPVNNVHWIAGSLSPATSRRRSAEARRGTRTAGQAARPRCSSRGRYRRAWSARRWRNNPRSLLLCRANCSASPSRSDRPALCSRPAFPAPI